ARSGEGGGGGKGGDGPKARLRVFRRKTAYCTGSGRSRPSSRRTRSISLMGASGGRRRGTGSPERRMTTKTTVETSHRAMRARKSRWARNGSSPRIEGESPHPRPLSPKPPTAHLPSPLSPKGARARVGSVLRAAELEVEATDLELLIRIRGELHVLLEPIVLIGLDDGQPREVLEEDLGHLGVGLRAELLVHRETGGRPQLVELRLAPVVLRPTRPEETPHHAVGIAEGRGRIGPEHALEALLAVLLGAHGVLDHLHLHVHPDVLPHGRDGFRHGLVLGDVGDGGLDEDLLALVAGLLQPLARLLGVVGEGR